METIKVTISWLDNYGAYSEKFPGCVATNKSLEEVKDAFKTAFQLHLEGLLEDGEDISDDIKNGNYTFEFELNARALFHHYDKIITRSALSRITGINERQLGHYATGRSNPRPKQREKIVDGLHKIGKEFLELS